MKKQLNQVLQFHKIFGAFISLKSTSKIPQNVKDSRIKLIREETEELIKAIQKEGIREIAKELSDVLYVVLGTAISFGLQNNFSQVFIDVHKSNLSKIDKKGNFQLTNDKSKILKGKNYIKPELEYILEENEK